jgi:hypothetical protein
MPRFGVSLANLEHKLKDHGLADMISYYITVKEIPFIKSKTLETGTIIADGGSVNNSSYYAGGDLHSSGSSTVIRPSCALGMAYNFSKNFVLDFSWGWILGKKDKVIDSYLMSTVKGEIMVPFKSRIPFSNYLALGVSYKF